MEGITCQIMALARRVLAAGLSTVMLNGFMFVLGVVLVRALSPVEFGAYTMLVTILSVAGVVVGALVAQQMGYVLPRTDHPARQRSGGAMFGTVAAICILAVLPVAFGTLVHQGLGLALLLGGLLYIATTMYRTYARFYFFSLRQPQVVLRQDILFVSVGVAGLAALAFITGLRDKLALVLGVLTLANLLCSVFFSDAPLPAHRLGRARRQLFAYRRHARRAFWSFTTVLLSTLAALAPNIALMSTASLMSLALITAPGSVLAPIRVVTLTLQSTLRAEFSALIHAGALRSALLLYLAATAGAMTMSSALALAAWYWWDLLYQTLFAHGYKYGPIREATMISVAVAAANTIRLPGAVLLNASNIFRYSASVLFVVAPAALAIAFVLAWRGDVAEVLYAALFGEGAILVAELGAVIWLFCRGVGNCQEFRVRGVG